MVQQDPQRKANEHPAFANAGKRAGVEIWRIEDFEPVPVPSSDYGKFYRGDSYIILKTKQDNKGTLSWDIHYWLGSQTSQDEAGAAAILTVGLDDKFGGLPVQHRETEAHESSQFVGYFKPAIRYLDGGHATGFSHVTTNAGLDKRLFQVKGKRNVRVRQIEASIASMNKGDCFILDIGHEIYVYVGEKAKNIEKLKAVSVANQIRDQDHHGRAKITIIDSTATENETENFFKALGSGSRKAVPEESAGGDDQAFERNEEQTITLYEISDRSGSLQSTPVPRPYKQEQLNPAECYILDTVSGSIYVWVGKQATQREKTEAMNKAQQFLTQKRYPAWVQVTRIPQGTEPAAFKQYFTTWRDVGMAHSRLVRSPSDEEFFSDDEVKVAKRARVIGKTGAARGFIPDQADGTFTVYRLDKDELTKLYTNTDEVKTDPKRGFYYSDDIYLIQYQNKQLNIIYTWIGKDTKKSDRELASRKVHSLDEKMKGETLHVQIPQGEETLHFLHIFNGQFVSLYGGAETGYQKRNTHPAFNGIRLFRVHGSSKADIRAEQVPETLNSLNTDDVFILESDTNGVFLWFGKDSSVEEREKSVDYAVLISDVGANNLQRLEEGNESETFMSLLGKQTREGVPLKNWRHKVSSRIGFEPKLYEATLYSNNKVTFDEIVDFDQDDLAPDDVYLLDSGDEIYLWIGSEAPPNERKSSYHIVYEYLWNKDKLSRNIDNAVVIVVKQGIEPEAFIKLFEKWDPQLWQKQRSYNDVKDAIMNNTV